LRKRVIRNKSAVCREMSTELTADACNAEEIQSESPENRH
jgi:hypothetical protein